MRLTLTEDGEADFGSELVISCGCGVCLAGGFFVAAKKGIDVVLLLIGGQAHSRLHHIGVSEGPSLASSEL